MSGMAGGGGGASFSAWYNGAVQPPQPGAIAGSTPPGVWARSVEDARRMMLNRTPDAEYPDGYLGTITSRRGDRVLDALKARTNQRSYQRGVHMGERIDPGDYLWPEEFGPFNGIKAELEGRRQAPLLEYFMPTPEIDSKMAPRGSESILTMDTRRARDLSMLRPAYGLPGRRNLQPQA